jgi:hypothetical protein
VTRVAGVILSQKALQHYESSRKAKETAWWKFYSTWFRRMCVTLPSRTMRSRPFTKWETQRRSDLSDRAAEALIHASRQTPYLSSDKILKERTDELMLRLHSLVDTSAKCAGSML